MQLRFRILAVNFATLLVSAVFAQDGGDLRELLQDVELGNEWVYNDVDAAFARAKAVGKPVLALFR